MGDTVKAFIPVAIGIAAPYAIPGLTAGTFTAGIVSAAAAMATSKVMGLDAMPDFDSATARGLSANVTGTVEPIAVCYGEVRRAGTRIFIQSNGNDNKYLHCVYALAEGEIDSITNVEFNNENYDNAQFAGLVDFGDGISASNHLGSDTQVADSVLAAEGIGWSANHTLNGVAYLYVRFEYDKKAVEKGEIAFPSLPTVICTLRGRKVLDVTNLGAAAAYSNNPANCIYDYLTNTRYGRGIDANDIDITSFQAAHAICAATVSNSPDTGARYTCDGIINIDNSPLQNIKDLLTSCRGYLIFSAGKYKLVVDHADTASFTFDESNIIGALSVKKGSKNDRYNRIRARYFNADKKHQPDIIVEDNTSYRSDDNGAIIDREIGLPFTTDEYRARRIAKADLIQSRFSTVLQFESNLTALENDVADVVNVTHPTLGYTTKKFRIIELTLSAQDTVTVTLREYDDSVYTLATPPTKVDAPAYTPPAAVDVTTTTAFNEAVTQRANNFLEDFENGDVDGWTVQNSTFVTTDDSIIGDVSALLTKTVAGTFGYAEKSLGLNISANSLNTASNGVRVQVWAKSPSSNASNQVRLQLVGTKTDSTTYISSITSFTTTTTAAPFGVFIQPNEQIDDLRIRIRSDVSAGTGAVIIDNVNVFVIPDRIDTGNISTFIDNAAIGNAYIANAAVDTLTINGNAVTVPVSVQLENEILDDTHATSSAATAQLGSWHDIPNATLTLPAVQTGATHGIVNFFVSINDIDLWNTPNTQTGNYTQNSDANSVGGIRIYDATNAASVGTLTYGFIDFGDTNYHFPEIGRPAVFLATYDASSYTSSIQFKLQYRSNTHFDNGTVYSVARIGRPASSFYPSGTFKLVFKAIEGKR